jgi:hypothetical protein
MFDIATVKASVPKGMRSFVNQEFMDKLVNISSDPVEGEALRENVLGYIEVLNTGKYKMDSYLNAIKYVTYLGLGATSLEGWARVFPDKYAHCVAQGMPEKTIHSYASHFKKSKLVTELFDRLMVPTHILNAPYFQEAINKNVELMRSAKSERIQMEAANSLLVHLKRPESQKIELDIAVKDDSVISELKDITMGLAAQQKKLLESGAYSVKDVSNQGLIIEGQLDG